MTSSWLGLSDLQTVVILLTVFFRIKFHACFSFFFQLGCVALCKEKDELRERTYPLLKRDSMKASVSTAAVAGWQRGDTNRVWKRSSYGLTSDGRCCERLYLKSAQRACPPSFISWLNLAWAGGLTCPRRRCRPAAGSGPLPLVSPSHSSGLTSPSCITVSELLYLPATLHPPHSP